MAAEAVRQETLRALRLELVRRQAEWRRRDEAARCPTGVAEADGLLGGGFAKGEVTLLGARPGAGATTLLGRAAARVTQGGGLCAWVDPGGTLSARALERLGVVLDRLLWIRAPEEDAPWAAQVLARCGAFALVVLDLGDRRVATAAGHRLADAARAGSGAVVLVGESDAPAGTKMLLDAQVRTLPRIERQVRLRLERTRRGGADETPLSSQRWVARPPESWRANGPVHVWRGPALDTGTLPVVPLVERRFTRPRSRGAFLAGVGT